MRESPRMEAVKNIVPSTRPDQNADALHARSRASLTELTAMAKAKFWLSRLFTPLLLICKIYVVGYLCIAILMHLFVSAAIDNTIWCRICVIMVEGGFLWALIGDTRQNQTRLKKLVSALGEDPRAVGALAQICYSAQFLSIAEIAVEALRKLLPRVKASDAEYFSQDQMQALLGLLAPRNPHRINLRQFEDLPIAVLKALEQIGDSRAIEPVRRLTIGQGNRRYHRAAQECLASIEQNGGKRDYNHTLLLPASAEVGQEALLRAAGRGLDTPPERLLRAVSDEERG